MAFYEDIQWFCLFELDAQKHIIRATGPKNKEFVQKKIQQMHPKMKIIDLHELKDEREVADAAAKLAADSNWEGPITNEQLRDSAAVETLGEQAPELLAAAHQQVLDAQGNAI